MKKIISTTLSVIILFATTSCDKIAKKEIINDLKIAEELLPIMVDENTMCLDLYYDNNLNAVTIEYIRNTPCTFNKTTNSNSFIELLQNDKENDIYKLLMRCADANLNLRTLTYSSTKDTLLDITLTPQEYALQK